jgi:lipoate-protein ligase A
VIPATCRIVEYACLHGERNMSVDRGLLALCDRGEGNAYLRFYTWAGPTVSLGRFESTDVMDVEAARRDGVGLVRRPTGGRAVLHGDDLTYTLVVPVGSLGELHEIYGLISEILAAGLSSLGARVEVRRGRTREGRLTHKPCFASVSRYEVTYRGRKLVGSAQRVGRRAVLQHGSIPLGSGYLGIVKYMTLPEPARGALLADMKEHTCCLSEVVGGSVGPQEAASRVAASFRERLPFSFADLALDDIQTADPGAAAVSCLNARDKSP